MKFLLLAVAAGIAVQVINGPDAELEPSIQNEVDHALSRASLALQELQAREGKPEMHAPPNVSEDVFGTNGLSRAAIAIKLISAQRSDGTWYVNGTNVTAEAVGILLH